MRYECRHSPPKDRSTNRGPFLGELVRRSDPDRPIIEIGTLFGYSTRILAANKTTGQRLITIDNYTWNPLGLSRANHRIATRLALAELVSDHDATVMAMSAAEFYRSYAGPPPALFFCDADHSYEAVLADLTWAIGAGTTIICGDDTNRDIWA
jgi:predicted O-methyltransferase YrrM